MDRVYVLDETVYINKALKFVQSLPEDRKTWRPQRVLNMIVSETKVPHDTALLVALSYCAPISEGDLRVKRFRSEKTNGRSKRPTLGTPRVR